MEYIPLILAGLGILLIVAGSIVSIIDWNRKHHAKSTGVTTGGTSLPKSITALAKLAEALKNLSLGMQFIFVGMAMEIIAAFMGGIILAVK